MAEFSFFLFIQIEVVQEIEKNEKRLLDWNKYEALIDRIWQILFIHIPRLYFVFRIDNLLWVNCLFFTE